MIQQRILRVPCGQSIPQDWKFVKWLGTETSSVYGTTEIRTVDVVLARYRGEKP